MALHILQPDWSLSSTKTGMLDAKRMPYIITDGRTIVDIVEGDLPPRYQVEGTTIERREGEVATPGCIDMHVHPPQDYAREVPKGELMTWLIEIWKEESEFIDPDYASDRGEEVASQMLERGTVGAATFGTIHVDGTLALTQAMADKGLFLISGLVQMDQYSPKEGELIPGTDKRFDFDLSQTTGEAMEAARAYLKRTQAIQSKYGDRVQLALAPRFAPTCSKEIMEFTGALAKETGIYVHTHLSESEVELQLVRERHPQGANYTDVYREAGLLNERSIMAHVLHVTPEEMQMLADTGTIAVHCPESNLVLGNPEMPWYALLDRGVRLALGSDVGAGNDYSMIKEMKHAVEASERRNNKDPNTPIMPYQTAFFLGTRAGAEAMGLEGRMGSIEAGKDMTVALYRLPNTADLRPLDVLRALIQQGKNAKVSRLYIEGQQRYAA